MLLPVRLSVVCLSSVTLVYPTQPVEIFGSVSTYLVPWLSVDIHGNFTEIVPGEPLRWGVKRKRGSQMLRFLTCQRLYLGTGAK